MLKELLYQRKCLRPNGTIWIYVTREVNCCITWKEEVFKDKEDMPLVPTNVFVGPSAREDALEWAVEAVGDQTNLSSVPMEEEDETEGSKPEVQPSVV